MLINSIKNAEEFKNLSLPKDYIENLFNNSSNGVLEVIAKVIAVVLRKQNVPENEIQDMVDQVKRRQSMALFDGWKGFDYQAVKSEGIKEGKAEERESGIEIFIKDKIEDEIPADKIVTKLQKNYNLTEETAKEYVQKYSPVAMDK